MPIYDAARHTMLSKKVVKERDWLNCRYFFYNKLTQNLRENHCWGKGESFLAEILIKKRETRQSHFPILQFVHQHGYILSISFAPNKDKLLFT